jgi:hypothetical protein
MPKMGIPKKRIIHARRQQSLADALFSTTQQRVLALLFGQPGRSFYATELIGLTGAGSGAVQRELARLEQSGLVTVRRLAGCAETLSGQPGLASVRRAMQHHAQDCG